MVNIIASTRQVTEPANLLTESIILETSDSLKLG
jgi:hypothetical protein